MCDMLETVESLLKGHCYADFAVLGQNWVKILRSNIGRNYTRRRLRL